jgi:hypothetical protein
MPGETQSLEDTMRRAGWVASFAVALASGAGVANASCAGAIQQMEASGRLTPKAQQYLDKAKDNLGKKTHAERDCLSWVDAADQEMAKSSRRYGRNDDRYERRDQRYSDRDRDYDRYDRRTEGSGSSRDPVGRRLDGLGR